MNSFFKYIVLSFLIAVVSFVVFEQFFSDNTTLIFVVACVLISLYLFRNTIRTTKLNQQILVFSFLIIITIPLIGKKETESLEKRRLAEFPQMKLDNVWEFFFDFSSYFSDRFAYRNTSVSAISKFKYKVFSVSPVPNIVTVGKDNWLFYTIEPVLINTCVPFTKKQLETIKWNLKITTKWFDLRNIKYYFTIIPFKSRIYPEMMPDYLKIRMKFANYVQVLNYLKNDTTLRLINCTDDLIKEKKVRPIYYKTDTHWNEYGAFIGYKKIIERVHKDFPQIIPFQLSDFTIDSTLLLDGDLLMMMGLTDFITAPKYKLNFVKPFIPITAQMSIEGQGDYTVEKMPHKVNGLRLTMIRDSFTQYLKLFLTPNFDCASYFWCSQIPVNQVVETKPNIVIHEMLEQFISTTLELSPDIKQDTAFLRKNFPEYHY